MDTAEGSRPGGKIYVESETVDELPSSPGIINPSKLKKPKKAEIPEQPREGGSYARGRVAVDYPDEFASG